MRADFRISQALLCITLCGVLGVVSLVVPICTRNAVAASGDGVVIIEDHPTAHSASHAATPHTDSHIRHSEPQAASVEHTGRHRSSHSRHTLHESTVTSIPVKGTSLGVSTGHAASPGVHGKAENSSSIPATTAGVYEAECAELAGAATIMDEPGASGGKVVSNLAAQGSMLTFKNVDGGVGGSVPCVISYANGDSNPVSIGMTVNGASSTITLPPTGGWSGASTYQTVTCHPNLKSGMTNTIQFSTIKQDWVCDKITLSPLLPTTFTVALQSGVISVMANYWPFVLMLMVIGVLVYLIRQRHQYY